MDLCRYVADHLPEIFGDVMKYIFGVMALTFLIACMSSQSCHPHTMMIGNDILVGKMCGNDIILDGFPIWPIVIASLLYIVLTFLPFAISWYLSSLLTILLLIPFEHYRSANTCEDMIGQYEGRYCHNRAYKVSIFTGKYHSPHGETFEVK